MLSSTAAPWPALRQELQLHEAGTNRDGSPAWHVADPVRNLFFRIGWLEFETLRRWHMGDARAIAHDIAAHTTLAAEEGDVKQFVDFLQQQRLVRQTSAPPKPSRPGWKWLLDNYLFIRIPLVRPEPLLRRLLPWVDWLFSRWFLLLTLFAGVAGVALAARQWDTVQANLAGALTWDGITGFAAALIASKLIHEMGHALVSTRHGVRVGHMGVAFLVLWPMPYTDTGESWKLADPRHRFRIASAGIASELMLAAWCTLLWALAPDGNLRNAFFFLATTAWVLTVAVNASPFMRFDGYFMLSDLLDYPGMHERAGRWAKRFVRHTLLGLDEPAPEAQTPGFRRFLIGFALATWVYRLVLFVGIALLVYHAFFKALGIFLFVVEIGVFIVRPVAKETAHWWAHRREVPRQRLYIGAALLLAGLLAVLVPWSSTIHGSGVLRAGLEQPLYAPFPAQLREIRFANGDAIRPGDVIAVLDEPAQVNERDKARALEAAYQRTARGALAEESDGAAKQAVAEQFASRWEAERIARDAELERLRLVAQHAGRLRDVDPTLHAGSWVSAHTPIAWLVDEQRWRVEALVTEKDALRLSSGKPARIYLQGAQGAAHAPLKGRIVAIDHNPVQKLPHLLLAQNHGGSIALAPGSPPSALRPAEALYRVLIETADDAAGGANAPHNPAVRRVQVQFEGENTSLAKQWAAAALSVLIQQADF